MKKHLPHILAFAILIVIIFAVSGLLHPQTIHAEVAAKPSTETSWLQGALGSVLNVGTNILLAPLGWLAIFILQIATLITYLSGAILNYVVGFTIVEMADRISGVTTINLAWGVIRDLANMSFIFVLLYAAIKTILGMGDNIQKLIVNIIIVAVLINFSLFFTKIIIDASNILAITFYDAIAPGALESAANDGLSDSIMKELKITSLWDAKVTSLEGRKLIIVGVMGTIVALIAAFIFFAIAIMLVIRYVVLVFVLILSPLAFIGFVLPQLKEHKDRWWKALSGQAFFAPIYFMLTWIVVIISRGLFTTTTGDTLVDAFTGVARSGNEVAAPPLGSIEILINFIVMIAFLITSLVVAKDWANKAGGQVVGLTKWAMGAASGAAFGGLGWAGRTTFGRLGAATAENVSLQAAANKQRAGFMDRTKGAASRLALYASEKARGGSFDVRSATIPTSAVGDLVQGTVGRTRLGKRFGLNDVNIPSIPVGSFAAGQTGVGEGSRKGFVDVRTESRKRVEARERKQAEEYREAESKLALKKGLDAAASPDDVAKMQREIKDMTNKEIIALDRNTLANEKVAEALTAQQLKAVNDSEKPEAEKRQIFDTHFAKAAEAAETLRRGTNLATGAPLTDAEKKSSQNIIRNISDKEVDYVPTSIFDPGKLDPATAPGLDGEKSRAFFRALTPPQVDNLTKGDRFIASEKQAIKDAGSRPIDDAFTTGNWTGTPNSAVELMRQMRPEALVQLDDAKLTNPHILDLYRPALLAKMAARSELTEAKANAIRKAIMDEVARPGATPSSELRTAADWLNGDGLKIF